MENLSAARKRRFCHPVDSNDVQENEDNPQAKRPHLSMPTPAVNNTMASQHNPSHPPHRATSTRGSPYSTIKAPGAQATYHPAGGMQLAGPSRSQQDQYVPSQSARGRVDTAPVPQNSQTGLLVSPRGTASVRPASRPTQNNTQMPPEYHEEGDLVGSPSRAFQGDAVGSGILGRFGDSNDEFLQSTGSRNEHLWRLPILPYDHAQDVGSLTDYTQQLPLQDAHNPFNHPSTVATNNNSVQESNDCCGIDPADPSLYPGHTFNNYLNGYEAPGQQYGSVKAASEHAGINDGGLQAFLEDGHDGLDISGLDNTIHDHGGVNGSGYDFDTPSAAEWSQDVDFPQRAKQYGTGDEASSSSLYAARLAQLSDRAIGAAQQPQLPSLPPSIARNVVHKAKARAQQDASINVEGEAKQAASVKALPVFIPGYDDPDQPIPADKVIEDICAEYPNHLIGDGLDPFLQWRWSHIDMWHKIPGEIVQAWKKHGIIGSETKDIRMFLCNRLRMRRDHHIKHGTLGALLNAPKLYESNIGYRKGLTNLEKYLKETPEDVRKRQAKRKRTVLDEEGAVAAQHQTKKAKAVVDDNQTAATATATSTAQEGPLFQQDFPNINQQSDQHLLRSIRPIPKMGFNTAFEKKVTMMPSENFPDGLFFGLPFWQNEDEFRDNVKKVDDLIDEYKIESSDLVAADPKLAEADELSKLDKRLSLLGLGAKRREAFIGDFKSSGKPFDEIMEKHIATVAASMMKSEAHKCLTTEGKGIADSIAGGIITPDFVKQVRNGVVKRLAARLDRIEQSIKEEWIRVEPYQPELDIVENNGHGEKRGHEDNEGALSKLSCPDDGISATSQQSQSGPNDDQDNIAPMSGGSSGPKCPRSVASAPRSGYDNTEDHRVDGGEQNFPAADCHGFELFEDAFDEMVEAASGGNWYCE